MFVRVLGSLKLVTAFMWPPLSTPHVVQGRPPLGSWTSCTWLFYGLSPLESWASCPTLKVSKGPYSYMPTFMPSGLPTAKWAFSACSTNIKTYLYTLDISFLITPPPSYRNIHIFPAYSIFFFPIHTCRYLEF